MSPVGRLVVLREDAQAPADRIAGLIVWPALIGPVVGPPLGGLIATYASWHWIFFINLPIGAAGLWLVLRHVPRHVEAGERRPFDLRGFALTALSLVTLLQGLAFMGRGARQPAGRRGAGGGRSCAGLGRAAACAGASRAPCWNCGRPASPPSS